MPNEMLYPILPDLPSCTLHHIKPDRRRVPNKDPSAARGTTKSRRAYSPAIAI